MAVIWIGGCLAPAGLHIDRGRCLLSTMPEATARPWITYALIAANVAMFGFEIARGASPIAPTSQQMLDLGASYPPLTLDGEWWRLGSSMFLHFGVLHIALNMVCLYQARVVEQLFGHLGFIVIYVLAGLGGGIAMLVASSSHVVGAGASGAVFGVYGAFGAFLVLRRSQIHDDVWRRTARAMGRFLLLNLAIGLAVTSVSISAHIGGVIIGFGAGAALLAGARAAQQRTLRALGLLVLGIALTAVAVTSLHAAPDMIAVLDKVDAVERAAVARWNEALAGAKAQTITAAELVEILEREVVFPYKKMRQDTLATADVPQRFRPLFHRLDDYTAARLTAWEMYDAALHEPDPNKRQALLDAYERHEPELAEKLAALNAEIVNPTQ
jgi:rhomboid protease GluP